MLFVQLVWLPILTVVTLFMRDCSSIGQCNAFARQKLRVQAPSIPTRLMIGLWVKCSRSHPLFIMFFFVLFFLFYVISLNCILILLDNVFGLFEIFFFFLIDWLDFLYLTLYLGLSYENHVCGSLWLRNH